MSSANPRAGLLRTARLIKRRVITVKPMSRVSLFQCAWCTLSSDVYQKMSEHICPVKRVKARSALETEDHYALLESLANPQWAYMRKTYSVTHLTLEKRCYNNPRTLHEIALKYVRKISDAYDSANKTDEMGPSNDKDKTDSGFITGTPSPQGSITLEENAPKCGSATDERTSRSMNGVGYYCHVCSRIFAIYGQYDAHLARSWESGTVCARTAPDPMEIHLSISDYLPESGRFIELSSQEENASKPKRYECSKCHRNDFAEAVDLHTHIFVCALN